MSENPERLQLRCAKCDSEAGSVEMKEGILGTFRCPQCRCESRYAFREGQMTIRLAAVQQVVAPQKAVVNQPRTSDSTTKSDAEVAADSADLQYAFTIMQRLRVRSTELAKANLSNSFISDDLGLAAAPIAARQKLEQLQGELQRQLLDLIRNHSSVASEKLADLANGISVQIRDLLQRKNDPQKKVEPSLNSLLNRFSTRVNKVVGEAQDSLRNLKANALLHPVDVSLTPRSTQQISDIAQEIWLNSLSEIRPEIEKDQVR